MLRLETFGQKLLEKYPDFRLKFSAELLEILEYAKTFSDWNRGLLWNEFRDTYIGMSIPRRAHFVKIGRELGIAPQQEAGVYWEYSCSNCQAPRPLNRRECPRCQSLDCALIKTDRPPVPESERRASDEEIAEFEVWLKGLGARKAQVDKVKNWRQA